MTRKKKPSTATPFQYPLIPCASTTGERGVCEVKSHPLLLPEVKRPDEEMQPPQSDHMDVDAGGSLLDGEVSAALSSSDDEDDGEPPLLRRKLMIPHFRKIGEPEAAVIYDSIYCKENGSRTSIEIQVSVARLMTYFSLSDNKLATKVISKAQYFADHVNNRHDKLLTELWTCCRCEQQFPDPKSHFEHVETVHLCDCLTVRKYWSSMILDGIWKPLDTSVAMATLLLEWQDLCCNQGDQDSSDSDSDVEFELELELERETSARNWFLGQSWPLSDDPERASSLSHIQSMLGTLLSNHFLTQFHLDKVITYCVEELEGLIPSSSNLAFGLGQTHLCICFLGSPQLQKILSFFREMIHLCDDGRKHPEPALQPSNPVFQNEATVFLQGDSLRIGITEHSVRAWTNSQTYSDALKPQGRFSQHIIAFFLWTISAPSAQEHLQSSVNLQLCKRRDASLVLLSRRRQFDSLLEICEDTGLEFTVPNAFLVLNFRDLQRLKLLTFNPLAATDYRPLLIYLVKSYLQALTDEDAIHVEGFS